jgi:hypothetical protein
METVYNEIDAKAIAVLEDIMHKNRDLHWSRQLGPMQWEKCISTAKANLICTQFPERWISSDVHEKHKLGCKRARTWYIVTSEPSSRVTDACGAAHMYIGSVHVVVQTLVGLLEQYRSRPSSRYVHALDPRCVASLQKRVAKLTKRKPQHFLSLAHLPVIIAGYPGTVGLPVGTVVRTPHTVRVVQRGSAEAL